ncbi:hypothetical protein [Arthrobacter cryoconiti]|uniref:Uncharacterized protein n=1 Tax=Arthrobacter cryoconiti TaxID=748907 RepID=A0ABV8R046_9MICC|nr:hypothetical protein [Arthrobacter cryoconiti]
MPWVPSDLRQSDYLPQAGPAAGMAAVFEVFAVFAAAARVGPALATAVLLVAEVLGAVLLVARTWSSGLLGAEVLLRKAVVRAGPRKEWVAWN